jgi:phospholipid/cholesterol/gamma-HCH transport system permease protein
MALAVKRAVLEVQEYLLLVGQVARGLVTRPIYTRDIIEQLDAIGIGSLTVVVLTGLFTGMVLALQSGLTLDQFGARSVVGRLVGASMVKELGPVLTALMVTGRVGSGIAAELGSMVVTEQIAALRSLGTDPIRKLVAPRLWALLVSLPLLTVLADVLGIFGGWVTAVTLYSVSSSEFISAVRDAITTDDLIGGVVKPIVFSLIIGTIACRQGLSTEGGTVGVGRSTTRAVVMASIVVIIAHYFLAKALQVILGTA